MQGTESIARSTQIAIETEQIGHSVLGELHSQGDQLKRASERVSGRNISNYSLI